MVPLEQSLLPSATQPRHAAPRGPAKIGHALDSNSLPSLENPYALRPHRLPGHDHTQKPNHHPISGNRTTRGLNPSSPHCIKPSVVLPVKAVAEDRFGAVPWLRPPAPAAVLWPRRGPRTRAFGFGGSVG